MQLKEGKSPVTFLGQDRCCMSQNLSEVLAKFWNPLSMDTVVTSHKGFLNTPAKKTENKKKLVSQAPCQIYFQLPRFLQAAIQTSGIHDPDYWSCFGSDFVYICWLLLALCSESLSIMCDSESRKFRFSIWDPFSEVPFICQLCGFYRDFTNSILLLGFTKMITD